MEFNFKDKVVLITGATRGIGEQLAKDFGELGANLILTGTKSDQIEKLNKSLRQNSKMKGKCYRVDFLQEDSLAAFISELQKYNKIDVCINNAGVNKIDYFCETSIKDWNDIIQVNLKVPFIISKEVAGFMKNNGSGRIVNVASIFGVISREKRSIYTSSKSGLIGMTKSMAIDLAPYNILVNSVSPGFVLTDLTKKILSASEIEDLQSRIPLKKFADPADISKVIMFLSSDLNTYISGQNIIVDGGYVNV